jgi:hypothetical protein
MNTEGFTMISNSIVNDKNLSLRAKGLYLVLSSNCKGWQINLREIASRSVESYEVHKGVMNELIRAGLIKRNGKAAGTKYEISSDLARHIENDEKHLPPYYNNKGGNPSTTHSDEMPNRDAEMPINREAGMPTNRDAGMPYNNTNNTNKTKIQKEERTIRQNHVNVNKDPEIRDRDILSSSFSSLENSLPMKNEDLISKIDSHPVMVFIDNMLKKFPHYLEEEVGYLLCGVQAYLLKEKNRNLEIDDVKFIYDLFIRESDEDVYYVCVTYNDEDVHASHGIGYIKGILEKHKEYLRTRNNEVSEKEVERQKRRDLERKILAAYAAQKEEGDRLFGIEIASGKISGNRSYDAYVKLKDFGGLRKLYDIGCKELSKMGRETEIVNKYGWLLKIA